MKRLWSIVGVAVILGSSASVAVAYHCPLLVKECESMYEARPPPRGSAGSFPNNS